MRTFVSLLALGVIGCSGVEEDAATDTPPTLSITSPARWR